MMAVAVFVLHAVSASAQIYRVMQMNTEQIRALDRGRTVVLLPGGILEQHGPYLPSFSDGYVSERVTQMIAEAIVARAGWRVLVFPLIPLGVGAANEIGGKFAFDGSYTVRTTTLRAVFMDLATELGESGFRKVFVVHIHLAPNQSRVLDQACDYFVDTYGGQMVHLFGLMPAIESFGAGVQEAGETERTENGIGVHADLVETSLVLFLRPDLVGSGYANARSITGRTISELVPKAEEPGWLGYFGSPRHARPEIGARALWSLGNTMADLAVKILNGLDPRQLARYGDIAQSGTGDTGIDRRALAHEQGNERRQSLWLQKRGLQ
jgi:creatinine amidohydrolase/Fe(II)-dependent formamide hydrolase-like protein